MTKYLLFVFLFLILGIFLYRVFSFNNRQNTQNNAATNFQESDTTVFTNKYPFGEGIMGVYEKAAKNQNKELAVVNDASIWWKTDDRYFILNENEFGLVYRDYSCNSDHPSYSDNYEEKFHDAALDMSKSVDKVLNEHGFVLSVQNSSSPFFTESRQWGMHTQAYEKDKIKCVLEIGHGCSASHRNDPMSQSITFSCTDKLDTNYSQQKPFLEGLDIRDGFITNIKQEGDFYRLSVRNSNGPGGGYIIAKHVDGKWTKFVDMGQQYVNCADTKKYGVPTSILPCYEGNTLIE